MPLINDLRRAVKTLGGPNRTAKLADVGRTRLEYWLRVSLPRWACNDAERIVTLAADPKNWPTGEINGKGTGKERRKVEDTPATRHRARRFSRTEGRSGGSAAAGSGR